MVSTVSSVTFAGLALILILRACRFFFHVWKERLLSLCAAPLLHAHCQRKWYLQTTEGRLDATKPTVSMVYGGRKKRGYFVLLFRNGRENSPALGDVSRP